MATDEAKGARLLSDEEREVDVKDIKLPPEALRDALDNSAAAAVDETPGKPPADGPRKPAQEPDYVDGPQETVVPLTRPFRLEGHVVDAVRVRPLSVVETGQVIADVDKPDVFDFYAAMTGLPAAVIRGLRGVDGEKVTEAGYDFLPRFMRGGG